MSRFVFSNKEFSEIKKGKAFYTTTTTPNCSLQLELYQRKAQTFKTGNVLKTFGITQNETKNLIRRESYFFMSYR